MTERCSVSVVDHPGLVEWGPTPVGAPFLASTLAGQLFARMPAIANPIIRFRFDIPVLLAFSFELETEVVERLGALGAAIEICINSEATPFAAYELSADLQMWGAQLDPQRVTDRCGLTPTRMHRAGDILHPVSKRTAPHGFWELEQRSSQDANALARQLLDVTEVEAAAWSELCREADVRYAVRWKVEGMSGSARLDADVVSRLAVRGVPFACFFYNIDC